MVWHSWMEKSISRCSCSGRMLRDLRLELSRRTVLLSFLCDPGHIQFFH